MNRIKRIIKIFIAELPLRLLCLPKNKIGSAAAVILFFAAGLLLSTRNKSSVNDFSFEKAVFSLYISIIGGVLFYTRWQNTARMANFASMLAMPARQFCAVVTTGLCTCACFALIYLLHFFPFRESIRKHQKSADILFILLLAAGVGGYPGMALALFCLLLRAFGVTSLKAPYFSPVSPKRPANPDRAVRLPVWRQRLRGAIANPFHMNRVQGAMRAWDEPDKEKP